MASIILERLEVMGIKTSQLVAITTDNATNMISMIERLNEAFDEGDVAPSNDDNGDETELSIQKREQKDFFQNSFFLMIKTMTQF